MVFRWYISVANLQFSFEQYRVQMCVYVRLIEIPMCPDEGMRITIPYPLASTFIFNGL